MPSSRERKIVQVLSEIDKENDQRSQRMVNDSQLLRTRYNQSMKFLFSRRYVRNSQDGLINHKKTTRSCGNLA